MRDPLKLMFVAGARPNFMKVAPLIRCVLTSRSTAPDAARGFEYRLVHTGQHYDSKMSEVFFHELAIPAPDVNLEVGSGSHAVQTARIMERFEPVLLHSFAAGGSISSAPAAASGTASAKENSANGRPDWLVVVGDVNSTMACTLVASKLGVKVAHVEAGLRSFDRSMPEEINRLVTDALADLLLTPSVEASENLEREGIPRNRIRLVGNVMIDALVANLPAARASRIMQHLGIEPGVFVYVTLHRPSNVDSPDSLKAIMGQLEDLSSRVPVVFPMHPRTRKMLADFAVTTNGSPRFRIVEPVGYHDSLSLTENARLVITDSGGLQEESTYFRTPCLTVRPNTERPITVSVGSNRLTTHQHLARDIQQVLRLEPRLGQIPAFWDGHSAERILQELGRPH